MRYDYKELKELLLPDHKWVYFSIRVLRTNGWIYFLMAMAPVLGTFMISDQPKTFWTISGHSLLALGSGLVSLKAYRSTSPTDAEMRKLEDELKVKAQNEPRL